MVSGIIFSGVSGSPDHSHVGAWCDDDGAVHDSLPGGKSLGARRDEGQIELA